MTRIQRIAAARSAGGRSAAFCLLAALLAGCAHYAIQPNSQLRRYDPEGGYRFANLRARENSDSLFLILAFSGGGMRAAALAYGALEELARTEIRWHGRTTTLLSEVDVIAAVSGGSFPAAYYALFGDRIFTDFESRFLKQNIQWQLTKRLLYPTNWPRLASSRFQRIHLAAEYYDRHLFDRRTYGHLVRKGTRPFVVLSATDVTLGARFEFTQEQFDVLCSDLASFPLGRAVAASSAFPLVLTPFTLENHAGTCGYRRPQAMGSPQGTGPGGVSGSGEATPPLSYLNRRQHPYIHLLDGGVSDNSALQGPIRSLFSSGGSWSLLEGLRQGRIRKVVVLSVNSRADEVRDWDQRAKAPGLRKVAKRVIDTLMTQDAARTAALLRDRMRVLEQEILREAPEGGVEFFFVEVGFDGLADEAEQAYFKSLPTTLHLPPDTVDRLREVAGRLLRQNRDFQALLAGLR